MLSSCNREVASCACECALPPGPRLITEVCSLHHILSSSLGLVVSLLEPRLQLQHDCHDSGFHKSLFKKMRVPSEVAWEFEGTGWPAVVRCHFVPVEACQLVGVFKQA